MSGLRTLIVSSRYWPQVGEPERYVAELALGLRQLGLEPTLVSARWSPDWPPLVTHQGTLVVRLGPPPTGGWATYRYLRELARWIRQRRDQFDVAFVGNLRQEAYASVSAFAPGPVVLAPESLGVDGDCSWQRDTRQGSRIRRRCEAAAALIAASPTGYEELLATGYAESQVVRIAPGVALPNARSVENQHRARLALGTINHDLQVADYAPVVLSVERLAPHRGLTELIECWKEVSQCWPSARLWLVGDGPLRREIYDQLGDADLRHRVYMPGSFDDLEELFHAADIFIAPAGVSAAARPAAMSAMAAGLPVVAVATPDNRAMIESGTHGVLVPTGSCSELEAALSQLLESTRLRAQLGDAARSRIADRFSLSHVASQYAELFARLVGDRR